MPSLCDPQPLILAQKRPAVARPRAVLQIKEPVCRGIDALLLAHPGDSGEDARTKAVEFQSQRADDGEIRRAPTLRRGPKGTTGRLIPRNPWSMQATSDEPMWPS